MLELEHTLIMLLLLVNLLSTRPGIPAFLRWIMAGVILLAFLVPSTPLSLPWGLFAALFVPILLWQSAQRLGNAGWFGGGREFFVWLLLSMGITAVIFFTGGLPFTSALLFGLLAASVAWNAINPQKNETLLGQIGVLTLVFLLTGIEAAVEAPGQFLLALLAGGAIGAVVGFCSVLIASRLKTGIRRDLFSLGPGYLAYAIGFFAGMSAVAAAVMSIAVYVAYGTKRGFWAEGQISPRPFEQKWVFAAAVLGLAFFGWQTHVPFSLTVLLDVLLAGLLTTVVFLLRKWFAPAVVGAQYNLAEILFRVGLLLAASLLLWPKSLLVDPFPVLIALGFASVTAISASIVLAPMIQLFSWLEEAQSQFTPAVAAPAVPALLVKDVLNRDYLVIPPDTHIEEIPALLAAHRTDGALVVDALGKLRGIVTEADLFVKEETLPRTDVTYLTLFNQPVRPEYILETFASVRGQYRASDVMSHPVVTIETDKPLAMALQFFVTYGYKVIPVVNKSPENRDQLVGILTRADLIRKFLSSNHLSEEKLP